jgi:hypothetical protein
MSGTGMLDPVVRHLSLRCSSDTAFTVLTEQTGQWWPNDFSASGENLADVVIEPEEGGRVYEVNRDGGTYDWARSPSGNPSGGSSSHGRSACPATASPRWSSPSPVTATSARCGSSTVAGAPTRGTTGRSSTRRAAGT